MADPYNKILATAMTEMQRHRTQNVDNYFTASAAGLVGMGPNSLAQAIQVKTAPIGLAPILFPKDTFKSSDVNPFQQD